MKLTLFLICVNFFVVLGSSYSQNTKFTLNGKDVKLEDVIEKIKENSEFRFFYNNTLVDLEKRVDYNVENATVSELLNIILDKAGLKYEIVDKTIILSPKEKEPVKEPVEQQPQKKTITGKVTDEKGLPLPGVSIVVKGTTTGITTDVDGNYTLEIPDDAEILVFSFVGMKSKEVSISDELTINIVLEEEAVGLEEVVAFGTRSSLAKAIVQKRNSLGIIDGIVAKDIADFPDLNISESLQRIPGVTINRVLGEGQQVSVRGLAPEFTMVTINGQTVTSGNPGREVDFDVFASELFSNVNLQKSPSASQTEGGLSATIDMRTARPFDYSKKGTTMAASAQGVYNDLRGKVSPRLSFLASNNKLMNGKLGILGSISYSQSKLRQDNAEGLRFLLFPDYDIGGDGVVNYNDVEIPFIPRYVLEFKDRDRLGVTGAMQFRPNYNVNINFDVAYAKFDELRTRYSIDGLLNGNRSTPVSAIVDETNLATRATYDNVSSRSENIHTPEKEDLILMNLDGSWRFGEGWKAIGKMGYSKSTKTSEEFRAVYNAVDRFTYDLEDRIFVSLEPENTDFTNPDHFAHNQSRFINDDIEDEAFSAQMDLERSFDSGWLTKLSGGLRYSNREKGQVRYDGRFTVKDDDGNPLPVTNAIATNLPVDDFFHQYDNSSITRTWFVTDFDAVFDDPDIGGADFDVPQRYISTFSVAEETYGGYLQADFQGKIGNIPFNANLGLRVVHTNQASKGFLGDGAPVLNEQTYTNALPSLNTKFNLSKNLLFRATASRSLTRPTLTKLSPGGTVAPGNAVPIVGGGTAKLGNPYLSPFLATQFDFALEWYFADEALLSVTYFNKKVDEFIVDVTEERYINVGSLLNDNGEEVGDAPFIVTQPVNGEGATLQGVEVSVQMPFTFLPKPFDGFGALFNYTFADGESEILFNGENIKTLLPGQTRHSFNAIGYYEKGRFSARLAYAWRGSYLDEIRPSDKQRSNFYYKYGQLDANVQYEISDNIILVGNALNLAENETFRYAEETDRNISFRETGRFFTLGVRAKF